MSTMNEQIGKIAVALGCPQGNVIDIVREMNEYPVALTEKSLVYQVSNAMYAVGLTPNNTPVSAIASRL